MWRYKVPPRPASAAAESLSGRSLSPVGWGLSLAIGGSLVFAAHNLEESSQLLFQPILASY